VVDLRRMMMMDQPEMEETVPTDITRSTTVSSFASPAVVPALTVAFWALASTPALADSPDWGLFEGRIGSLLHPITMGSLLAWSISTALLGFQWRRQRTIGDEISTLKKTLPDMGGASSLSEALKIAQSAEVKDAWMITRLQNAASTDAQIKEMQLERKELSEKAPRDKHFNQGALLAFVGTVMAIEVRI
jgi:hypothetical protein